MNITKGKLKRRETKYERGSEPDRLRFSIKGRTEFTVNESLQKVLRFLRQLSDDSRHVDNISTMSSGGLTMLVNVN